MLRPRDSSLFSGLLHIPTASLCFVVTIRYFVCLGCCLLRHGSMGVTSLFPPVSTPSMLTLFAGLCLAIMYDVQSVCVLNSSPCFRRTSTFANDFPGVFRNLIDVPVFLSWGKFRSCISTEGALPQHAENSFVRVGALNSRLHQLRIDILIEDVRRPEWRAASAYIFLI